MGNVTPWCLLRAATAAEQETGLRLIQQSYAKQPDPSHSMELGVAFLWLRKYASAWEHFRSRIDSDPAASGDDDYGMAGVAKWCLGELEEAVAYWRAGLGANYARTSGLGVTMPLLLFFASAVKPEAFDGDVAKKLMLEKTKDLRIRSWPGPIVQFILRQIDDDELEDRCRGRDDQNTRERQLLADFYRGVMELEQGRSSVFKESMRKLTDVSQPEWVGETVFVSRIWNEEYFLARHEANVNAP